MKKYFIAISAALVSATTQAQCLVPESLAGKTFINVADSHYSPQNPNAGTLMKLEFGEEEYTNRILTKNITVEGHYRYQKLSETVGLVIATEGFGGQETKYTLLLNCLSDNAGTAIYTQTQGAIKPDNRQNTVKYTIDTPVQ